MRSVWLVTKREFLAYWNSPVAYAVLAVHLVLAGIFFFGELSGFVALSSRAGGEAVDVNQQVIRPYLYSVSVMVLFLLPLVSMRLLAEEKRQGTLEILLTTPVRESAVVLGKFLASLGLYVAMLLGSAAHVGVLFAYGDPEWGPVVTGFLGLFLTGGAYLAIGLFLSGLTQNQVVAATASFAVFLALWLAHWLGSNTSGLLATVLTEISFAGHFENFGRGVLDSADIVFYVSLIAIGLYASTQAVLASRWKP